MRFARFVSSNFEPIVISKGLSNFPHAQRALEEAPEPAALVLDYQPAPRDVTGPFARWYAANGTDSFAGCAALLFAILSWGSLIVGWVSGSTASGACVGYACAPIALLAAIATSFDRDANKLFPLVSIAAVLAFVLATSAAFR